MNKKVFKKIFCSPLDPQLVRIGFDVLFIIILICTLRSSVLSNKISARQLEADAVKTKYMYLTNIWNEIMRESIQFPQFNTPELTLNYKENFKGNELQQYEIYARWVGGFIEDLYFNEYQKHGWDFYTPTINDFVKIHKSWLLDHIDIYAETPEFKAKLIELQAKRLPPNE